MITSTFKSFKFTLFVLISLFAISANAATWYVDSSVASSGNGTSWASAWKTISAISGVSAGDTVYISGGASGNSQTYAISGTWSPAGGTSGHSITYQIGQDSLHNGTATFSGSGVFVNPVNYANIIGDAGDGKMHFATTGFSVVAWYNSSLLSNFRLGYINFGNMAGSGTSNGGVMYFTTVNGFRFDHNYVVCSDTQVNDFAYFVFAGTTWDNNLIDDNTIYVPHGNLSPNGPSIGADVIESGGSVGYSIYNNTFIGYNMPYTGVQHEDGWQDTGGSSYIKIYNNTFFNLGNSCLFADATFGSFANVQVYNNVCILSDINFTDQQYPSGINFWVDGGFNGGTATFNNIVIANNIAIGYGTTPSGPYGAAGSRGFILLANASTHGATFSGCLIANNVSVALGNQTDGGYIDTTGNSSTPVVDTVIITSGQTSDFVSFKNSLDSGTGLTMPTAANSLLGANFAPTSSATTIVGQGANESTYFTIDKNGNTRPSSGAWDVGPFIYGSTSTNGGSSLSLSPITANVSDVDPNTAGFQVYQGTSNVVYSATANVTGTNNDSWTWSYTLNGGSSIVLQSGSGTVSSVSFNYTNGTSGNVYVLTLAATAGTNSANTTFTTTIETPPAPNTSLAFQATSGTITSPMTITSNYISQATTTTNIVGDGEATYSFLVTNAANYIVMTSVNAPNDSANSLYVNIDAQPVDPAMCWDIFPLTSGFALSTVSWRGNGGDTNNQFIPKIFSLTSGSHSIIFAGREAGTELKGISIVQLPSTPQNLQVVPITTTNNIPTFSVK